MDDEPAADIPLAAPDELPPVVDGVPPALDAPLLPPEPSGPAPESVELHAASSGSARAAANTTEREGMIRR